MICRSSLILSLAPFRWNHHWHHLLISSHRKWPRVCYPSQKTHSLLRYRIYDCHPRHEPHHHPWSEEPSQNWYQNYQCQWGQSREAKWAIDSYIWQLGSLRFHLPAKLSPRSTSSLFGTQRACNSFSRDLQLLGYPFLLLGHKDRLEFWP